MNFCTQNRFILSILNGAVCILGDEMVRQYSDSLILRAICDNITHAIIGFLSVSIMILEMHEHHLSWIEKSMQLMIGTWLSSFIDIDHFLVAKSIKLEVSLLTGNPLTE